MDVGDLSRIMAGERGLRLIGAAKLGRCGRADGGIEPVVQRHAGAARGGFGSLTDGWIDALCTPRYARIHAFVRFVPLAHRLRQQLPRASRRRDNAFSAGRLPPDRLFRVTVNNRLKSSANPPKNWYLHQNTPSTASAVHMNSVRVVSDLHSRSAPVNFRAF